MASTKFDERITKLATEVNESRDRQIPSKLFIITDILDSAKDDTKKSVALRHQLWELGVLNVLHLVLKQDFSLVDGGWSTGAKLSSILSHVCCGLNLPDTQAYQDTLLNESIDNLFVLVRRVQNRVTTEENADIRKSLLSNYHQVLESLTLLFSAHVQLATKVLESPWLLQLLISDDVETALSSVALIHSIFRVKTEALNEVSLETRQNILDELVYKVTVNTNVTIARSAVKCLLRLCECSTPLVEFMCLRYRGLRPLLRKWESKGFSRHLKQLIQLLEAGNAERANNMHLHIAAACLQAWWRGTVTRNKLNKANTAFAKFHTTYRGRRDARLEQFGEEWQQVQLERQMRVQRQRLIRQLHERQMQIMEILPAAKIASYLNEEATMAAVKIQSRWRGHHERSRLHDNRVKVTQYRAAITIQRAARLWLERLETRRNKVRQWLKPPGLTDERRVELIAQIDEHRAMYPPKAQTPEERETLHNKTQEMLARYLTRGRVTRTKHQHREALLARLETDSQLLQYAPPLKDVTDKDIDMYSSRSVPVAMKAKQNHANEIRLLRQPWWRKLGDEYQDKQYEEEDLMLAF